VAPASSKPDGGPASTEPASQVRESSPEAPASAAPAGAGLAASAAPQPEAAAPEAAAPQPEAAASQSEAAAPASRAAAPVAARFVGVERDRPLPSIERALSGPGSRGEVSWRRQVKVVAGGQGPGKRDQEALDRDRVRLPLAGPRRIVVLGCTRGAGQTVTASLAGQVLAVVRGVPVAALDLNPGPTSLTARRAPAATVQALLAGQEPDRAGQPDRAGHPDRAGQPGRAGHPDRAGQPGQPVQPPGLAAQPAGPAARLDVIADLPGNGLGNDPGNGSVPALEGDDFRRLADLLAERYPLTMIDPAPSGLTRVLSAADQLVLVAPASPDAATSLANTQQWLGAHGHGELAARAVTVINGVSRRTMEDVLRAESVARGRCRAIVRVPWDDLLSARPAPSPHPHTAPHLQLTLAPQTRLAYTALAGVLVAGMAATAPSVPGRNPGEHSD